MDLSVGALLFAVVLFSLRVINYAISTIRLVFIARNMRLLAAATAFLEALIFAVVMASIVQEIDNIINLTAYCLGAAGGSYAGMWLESRFVVSYSTVTVITRQQGAEIADALRQASFGVTMTHGEGRDGPVQILRSSTINKDIPYMTDIIKGINEAAFIEIESARTLSRGWIPGGPPGRRAI